MDLTERAKKIRLVGLDIDGVMTDGSIITGNEGELFKRFYVRDGLGIQMLQKAGIPVAVITGRSSKIVAERCRELGIKHVSQGQLFKGNAYQALLNELGLQDDQIAYMGDDVPDLPVLMRVGLACTPRDGNPALNDVIHWRSAYPGGGGAIREMAELILKAQGRWDDLIHNTFVLGK